MPRPAKGRPADNVATIVVRFPPVVYSPARPLPILRIIVFIVVIVFMIVTFVIEQALPAVCPQFLVVLDGMAEMR
jgi:hypothetical protein